MKYNYMSRTTDSDTSLFTPIDWDVLYSACKSLTQVRSLRLLHLVRHCARSVLRGHLTVTSQELVFLLFIFISTSLLEVSILVLLVVINLFSNILTSLDQIGL